MKLPEKYKGAALEPLRQDGMHVYRDGTEDITADVYGSDEERVAYCLLFADAPMLACRVYELECAMTAILDEMHDATWDDNANHRQVMQDLKHKYCGVLLREPEDAACAATPDQASADESAAL